MIKLSNKKSVAALNNVFGEKLENFGLHLVTEKKQDVFAIDVLPTGSFLLDKVLNIGGWPCGKIIEIYGNDSSGKSTLTLQTVAAVQSVGKTCVYLDLENTLNPTWAKKIGVDVGKLYISSPENGEQTFSVINNIVKSKLADLIIVDSVATMVPNVEFSNEMEEQTVGLHARLMSKGIRILQGNLIDSKTTVIFINQLREKIGGSFFGPATTTTGGRALKYGSSIRVELKKTESIKHMEKIIGYVVKAMVVKNKFGSPMVNANLGLYFSSGFDQYHEVINEAIDKKVLAKNGSWYSYENKNIGQGFMGAKEALQKDKEKFGEIKKKITIKEDKNANFETKKSAKEELDEQN